MKTPRPYQAEAAQALYNSVQECKDNHPIAAIPTGAGKTMVMCDFINTHLSEWPRDRILVLSHVAEILEQNLNSLEEHFDGIEIGLYSAGMGSRTIKKITVAGIQSIYRKPELFERFNIIIIDECHLVSHRQVGMYRKFLSKIDANYVGLTATHFRTGHGYIHMGEDRLFNKLVYNLCTTEGFKMLLDNGWLCPLIAKGTGMKLNTKNLAIRMGDYIPKQLSDRFDRASITKRAVEEIIAIGEPYKKWLVFAIDIKHAENIAKEFRDHGIPTGCVHSKMEDDRPTAIGRFKRGDYRCMVNVDVLTTGFDDPGIDLIALLRPTESPIFHVQSAGRGMRILLGKLHCLVLDFAGNFARMGPINDIKIEQKTSGKGGARQMMKECPNCQGLLPIQARECMYCGHVYPVKEKIVHKPYEGEIIRLEKPVPKKEWLDVVSIKYHKHDRPGKNMMVKVSYLTSGFKSFYEYVCYDHPRESYARHKAINWVKFRLGAGKILPYDCEELLSMCNAGHINKPAKIQVLLGGRFPTIEDMMF
jgi:DNA repair protein RadD